MVSISGEKLINFSERCNIKILLFQPQSQKKMQLGSWESLLKNSRKSAEIIKIDSYFKEEN